MLNLSRHAVDLPYSVFGRSTAQRRWRTHEMVAHEGDLPDHLMIIEEGWAAKHRTLVDGSRQISEIYLPGDVCDPFWLEGQPMFQSIVALSGLRATLVPLSDIRERAGRDMELAGALWRLAQWSAERKDEWIVSLTKRDSTERAAHLFCEILARQMATGRAIGNACDLPITQHDLADLLGITPVHTNRTLQWLRGAGLIELRNRRLQVLDLDALGELAGFDRRRLSMETVETAARLLLDTAAAARNALLSER